MNNRPKQLLLSLIVVLSIFSCKKEKDEPVTTVTDPNAGKVTVINDMDRDVYLYIYDTARAELQYSTKVKANQSIILPKSTLDWRTVGCFYEWCTSDYTISTWGDTTIHLLNWDSLLPSQTIHITQGQPRNDLFICFNGGDSITKWKAVDALDSISGKSVWNNLNGDEQYLKFSFIKTPCWFALATYAMERKHFGNVIYDTTGVRPDISTIGFKAQITSYYLPKTYYFDFTFTNNLKPILPVSTTSFDTLYAKPANKKWYYVVVKQP